MGGVNSSGCLFFKGSGFVYLLVVWEGFLLLGMGRGDLYYALRLVC